MTVKKLIEALQQFPPDAAMKCGLSVPDLYINCVANLSISGDNSDPTRCTVVRLVTAAPPKQVIADQPVMTPEEMAS